MSALGSVLQSCESHLYRSFPLTCAISKEQAKSRYKVENFVDRELILDMTNYCGKPVRKIYSTITDLTVSIKIEKVGAVFSRFLHTVRQHKADAGGPCGSHVEWLNLYCLIQYKQNPVKIL